MSIQVESVDDQWGSKLDDGSWTGMVRLRTQFSIYLITAPGWDDCEGRGRYRGGQLLRHGRQGRGRGFLRRIERGRVLRLSRDNKFYNLV